MSVPIIVDGWLFQDLAGKNGKDKQDEAISFLFKLETICDRIVFLEDSQFCEKAHELMGSDNSSPRFRAARSAFIDLIGTNSLKKYDLEQSDLSPLPDDYVPLIKDPSDFYLFQIYLKLKNKDAFILTSDGRWQHDKLAKKGVRIRLRDEFIPEYLAR